MKEKRGDGFVNLVEVLQPEAKEGEVLVKVRYAGICGSDINILHDRFPSYVVPVIMGHEFAGTVEQVGNGVEGFNPGERVVCETHAYVCNNCAYCRTGLYNLCPQRKAFGYGIDGAFTKLVSVRSGIIHKLPEEIPLREAAVLEPLSVVVNALTRNSRIGVGESVMVLGPGPIGLLSLEVARLLGGRVTVVGTERSKGRLQVAKKLGADSVMTDDKLEEALERGSLGDFDVVIIATGQASSFETALKAVRKNGRIIHIGESTDRASFQFSMIERKNVNIQGSFSHNWPIWETAITLVKDGKVDVGSLISHELPLAEWSEAFELVESRTGVKVLFKP